MRVRRKIRYNVVSRKFLFWVGGFYLLSVAAVVSSVLWVEWWLTASFTFHLVLTAVFFALLTAAMNRAFIVYDSAEMHFPIAFSGDLLFRLQRTWDDISAAGVEDDSNDYYFDSATEELKKRTLFVYFKSGGHVNLKLSDFEFGRLRHFVDQLIENSGRGTCTPELLEVQGQLKKLQDHIPDPSDEESSADFTKCWVDELAEHMSTTNFVPLEPGSELQRGKFLIERNISCGGMSAVYIASDERANKYVVKESSLPLRCDPALKSKAREMFEREALLLYKLKHPQIADVVDYFVENGRDYLVLNYVQGQSLRQFVRERGAVSEDLAIRIARQITDSVTYLHSQKPAILHRDLTPDNFVISDDERVVLIDFGAANEFISTATGTAVGKQCYVSPEQFKGRSNQQSDIYSIGCTLFYLLTGADPEPLSQSNPADSVSDVSIQLAQLVKDCTSLELVERLESVTELIQRLDTISENSSRSIRIDTRAKRNFFV